MSGSGDSTFRLKVTPQAREAFHEVLARQSPGSVIRIYVVSGPQPRPGITVDKPKGHELPMDVGGVPVLVDDISRKYLCEATVDYLSSGEDRGFTIEGPNVPPTNPGPSRPGAPRSTRPPSNTAATGSSLSHDDRRALLREAFRQIFDPEIPMNIVDLGLVYGISCSKEGRVRVEMTMTSPGCPVASLLQDQVETAARAVPGVSEVEVSIVWEPAWSPEKMSDFAKRQFGYL